MTQAGHASSPDTFDGWSQVYESAVPARLHPTTFVMEQAVARITDRELGIGAAVLAVLAAMVAPIAHDIRSRLCTIISQMKSPESHV